ncbi:hypothetical protein [Metamycoplasma canadense]|uniref:hypothetical protein n=1 Tax=Metamycoplasma canadense TaxID=29554 RepID=UPI0005EDCA65|nr:hypothetical protein [Metamycoplasma canadense]
MNKKIFEKSSKFIMFSAIKAAFFAIEIINNYKKDIISNCGFYTANNNMILGGIYNENHFFN